MLSIEATRQRPLEPGESRTITLSVESWNLVDIKRSFFVGKRARGQGRVRGGTGKEGEECEGRGGTENGQG